MSKLMNVSSSPHARSRLTTSRVMGDVILALLPATAMGVYHFGSSALVTILVALSNKNSVRTAAAMDTRIVASAELPK